MPGAKQEEERDLFLFIADGRIYLWQIELKVYF